MTKEELKAKLAKRQRDEIKVKAKKSVVTAKAKVTRKKPANLDMTKQLDTVIEDSVSEISDIEANTKRK